MKNAIVIDVESDGPCPGTYSMISIGCVSWNGDTFYEEFAPISLMWEPEALAISNISRDTHCTYPEPQVSTKRLLAWLMTQEEKVGKRLTMWSDNPAFDWQWVNYYLHTYTDKNPLGFSARRIGDFYAGLKNDVYSANKWKKLRKTKHTHHPVDDAKGNMEALKQILRESKNPVNDSFEPGH
jgi:hypothetical protein